MSTSQPRRDDSARDAIASAALADDDLPLPAPPCQACHTDRHDECTGRSWDPVGDVPAPCPCDTGHAYSVVPW